MKPRKLGSVGDVNCCFELRIQLFRREIDPRLIVIRAYDDLGWDSAGRIKLTCEVRHAGKIIFPRGQLTCALHAASGSRQAKELVMSLVAMHPSAGGGEGWDYYDDYTPEQLDWVEAYGEHLDMERSVRYCDHETGECRP